MASLDPARKKTLKAALLAETAPWILCALTCHEKGIYESLDGLIGLIDWTLHGQVSRLLKESSVGRDDICLFPGDLTRKRPSFILAPSTTTAAIVLETLRDLGVKELAIAESTFPADFRAKLKQTLKKEGIRCTTLEPEPDEPR